MILSQTGNSKGASNLFGRVFITSSQELNTSSVVVLIKGFNSLNTNFFLMWVGFVSGGFSFFRGMIGVVDQGKGIHKNFRTRAVGLLEENKN